MDRGVLTGCIQFLEKLYLRVCDYKDCNTSMNIMTDSERLQWIGHCEKLIDGKFQFEEFFYRNDAMKLPTDGKNMTKYQYIALMYLAYKEYVGIPQKDDAARKKLIDCIRLCEKNQYIEFFRRQGNDVSTVYTFAKEDRINWWKDYYQILVQTGLVCDSQFFTKTKDMRFGIGIDGAFTGPELFHFLFECYKSLRILDLLPTYIQPVQLKIEPEIQAQPRKLVRLSIDMLEKYYLRLKGVAANQIIGLDDADKTFWLNECFEKLTRPSSQLKEIIVDHSFFRDDKSFGIGNGAKFVSSEYFQYTCNAYKYLVETDNGYMHNEVTTYIKDCADMCYAASRDFAGTNPSAGRNQEFFGDVKEKWERQYYPTLVLNNVIQNSNYFGETINHGIGKDSVYSCAEIFHFARECYKTLYILRRLPLYINPFDLA